MVGEVTELVAGIYKVMADDDELWQCIAVIARKLLHAYMKEGFSRREALELIGRGTLNMMQPKPG